MVLSSEWTVLVDGKEAHQEVYEEERWERVTKDYEAAFLGEWEGKVTRDLGDETNDELHRWECNADGTYSFFDLVDDMPNVRMIATSIPSAFAAYQSVIRTDYLG